MKIKFKSLIVTTLVLLTVISTFSCKKNPVKKVALDTQFAVALFSDTVSLQQIIKDMDSTTQTWLRVRNDSLFAFYVDTVKDVLKASDLLSNIEDVSFNTSTGFNMPPYDPTNNHDTIIGVDRFMTIPFSYEGYNIDEVILRSGLVEFDFAVTPTDIYQHLKRLELYSNQLISSDGDTLMIAIDYDIKGGRQIVNLADYHVIPENDTVAFGARVFIHVDNGVYEGGDYVCDLIGGLSSVMFKTVYGTIDKPLDSIYNDETDIDFGIKGLTGSATMTMPTVHLDYLNTFGFGAIADVTNLRFLNDNTGAEADMIANEVIEVIALPTEGEWKHTKIEGLSPTITVDASGFTKLEFGGEMMMHLNDGNAFSISDTSKVDVAADIEMPFSFKLSDIYYTDTIAVDFSDASQTSDEVDDYIDEIEFFIDYNSKIKIDVDLQAIFMKNNAVLDSLFNSDHVIFYSSGSNIATISVKVNGRKLKNVLRSNQMVLRLGASTEDISDNPVQMMSTDAIFLRMRILTKTSEIDLDGIN